MNKKNIIFILILLFYITTYNYCFSKEIPIFILSSYRFKDPLSYPEYKGVIQCIQNNENKIKIYSYFLNSRILPTKEIKKKVYKAVQLIKQINPKLIITLDDLAFEVILQNFLTTLNNKNPFIVFSGVNKPIEEYNKKFNFILHKTPIKNVTGVCEHIFIKQQLELIEFIVKKPFYVALLYSTNYMGQIGKKQILRELNKTKYKNKIIIFPVTTFQELKKAVFEINNSPKIKAYFPLAISVRNPPQKNNLTLPQISSFLIQNIKKIDLGVNIGFAKVGFFGGVCADPYAMGYQAGQLAIKILQHYPIKNLKIENAKGYKIIINQTRINTLKLKIPNIFFGLIDELVQ
ncbi:ABC-type uncharacterized transport system, substrate-binding protein [Desulfonauticus submarinus]|uniref:ABC-type uncharacterized transport system, substrate-binding protein n=1 Tax=Desulfonauticus submarinus TaxID=206665 RepID=A0A1H0DKS3_9BACT|nr:ABC transporter substrate binding protein [Desulfonauticus submarinus]SDN70659.1 ABC-type uncharacterized transport system, substrate-binding protein [Desulfonauticus submarinus]